MKKVIYSVAIIIVSLFLFNELQAQTAKFNWPKQDSIKAQESYILYRDNYNNKQYKEAFQHLQWIYSNVPDLHEVIYRNGIRIFDKLIEKEEDAERKKVLVDSALIVYDMAIENFGNEIYYLNRKVYVMYNAYKKDKEQYENLYNTYKKVFAGPKKEVIPQNLYAYMDVARRHKIVSKTLNLDSLLYIYDEIIDVIKEQTADENAEKINQFKKIQGIVDEIFAAAVQNEVTCESLETNFGTRLSDEPDNVQLAKNILKLSFVKKCTKTQTTLQAAIVVNEHEPDFGLAKFIATMKIQLEAFDVAQKYYDQALSLTDDDSKKSDILLLKAKAYSLADNKIKAREVAYLALKTNAELRPDVYTLIGNLYMSSFATCKRGQNPVHDKAVFIAAYDKYKKAGNTKSMASAREHFPTIEEIFTHNMSVGDEYNIECWIREKITIDKK